jgi:hypothetical protein
VAAEGLTPQTSPISRASFSFRPRMTSKYWLKRPIKSRARANVLGGAFFGIGEVEEDDAARRIHGGADFAQDGLPNVAHVGEHGPVDKSDEVGTVEFGGEFFQAVAALDVVPGDFLEGFVFAKHDFAVVELQGVGRAGIGDAVDFGAGGEIIEDGMEGGMAECPDRSP